MASLKRYEYRRGRGEFPRLDDEYPGLLESFGITVREGNFPQILCKNDGPKLIRDWQSILSMILPGQLHEKV